MDITQLLSAIINGGAQVAPPSPVSTASIPVVKPAPIKVAPRTNGFAAVAQQSNGNDDNDAPQAARTPSASPTSAGSGAGLLSGIKLPTLDGQGTDLGSALRSVASGIANVDPSQSDLSQAASSFLGSSAAREAGQNRAQMNAAIDAAPDLSDAQRALAKANPAVAAALLVPDKPVLTEIVRPDGMLQKAWVRPNSEPSPIGAPYEAKDPNRNSDIQGYEYAKSQGYGGSFTDYQAMNRSPSTSIKIGDDAEARANLAKQYGMDPASPEGKAFILTGKMPREDQQPLTATDKRAILEADEMVAANRNVLSALDEAKGLSPKANAGWGAGTRANLGNNLPDWMVPDAISSPESSQATSELDNAVVSQALAQLKTIFGGNPTEGERKILLDLQGSSGQPDAVRQAIFDRAKMAAQRRLDFNQQRADELRGGQFYKPDQPAKAQQPAPGVAPGQMGSPTAPTAPAAAPADEGWQQVAPGIRMKQVGQ